MGDLIGLTPAIDKQSKIPIYQQLYHYIKKQIEAGIIGENERLPSIRQLSSHLMVSKNTVETAYQQLLAEGYVQSRLRSGMHVLPIETLAHVENSVRSVPEKDGRVLRHSKENLIDFQYGDVELERFPIKVWKKCLTDSLNDKSNEVLGYGDRQGYVGLRREIARYLYQSRGVLCSTSQIFLSAGTQQSVSLLCQVEGIVRRVKAESKVTPKVVATGGLAPLFARETGCIDVVDPDLTLKGWRLIYERDKDFSRESFH